MMNSFTQPHISVNSASNNGNNGSRPRPSMAHRTEYYTPALKELIAKVQSFIYLPDPAPLLLVMGTVIANLVMDGPPVWLMLVGPPSSGKSELLYLVSSIKSVLPISTMTEAALLSGTSKKDREANATGGVLRQIGNGGKGVLVAKDFTSTLSMQREKRASLLAAYRETYDGRWVRHLGVDGGQELSWYGKVGFLGGVTDTIDSHHSVLSTLGDRFIYCRLDQALPELVVDMVMDRSNANLRDDIQSIVYGFLTEIIDRIASNNYILSTLERGWLKSASIIAAIGRSAVERHPRFRDIENVMEPESPGRLIAAMSPLHQALRLIGCCESEAMRVITRTAVDCMPKGRSRVIRLLWQNPQGLPVDDMLKDQNIDHHRNVVLRLLQDMECLRIVQNNHKTPMIWWLTESFLFNWKNLHEET